MSAAPATSCPFTPTITSTTDRPPAGLEIELVVRPLKPLTAAADPGSTSSTSESAGPFESQLGRQLWSQRGAREAEGGAIWVPH